MAKKITNLDQIRPDRSWTMSRRAVLRLHLTLIGDTHKQLTGLSNQMAGVLRSNQGDGGKIDGEGLIRSQHRLEELWDTWFKKWEKETYSWIRDAASIPFGVLAIYHNQYLLPKLERERSGGEAGPGPLDSVFNPQLQAIVDANVHRTGSDGFNLSQRLWKLDRESKEGLKRVLANGVANGASAYDLAGELEQFLGGNARCPRWTRSRLRLTKKEIAGGVTTGLYTGADCKGQGVSYNALRLARTEIQYAHGLATDAMMAKMPWVEQEEVHLSADHAGRDECDAVAGVHPKGEVFLPIHPHCLCYKTAVLMKPDDFTDRLRGWMTGIQPWRAMDEYHASIGGNIGRALTGQIFDEMIRWLN